MLLTITTTRAPATDLGYLLHKHPDRLQTFATAPGAAHVFHPEVTAERCTAALLLEVDPVALVRGPVGRKNNPGDAELAQYVNDRPYAASSMLAVALKEAFRTALTGRCDGRTELAGRRIPLAIRVPALGCRGGKDLAGTVFEPLGWTMAAQCQPLAHLDRLRQRALGHKRSLALSLSATEAKEHGEGGDHQGHRGAKVERVQPALRFHDHINEGDRRHQDDHRDHPGLEVVQIAHSEPVG